LKIKEEEGYKDGMTGKIRAIGQKEVVPPGVLIAYEYPW
jgi:hypothetical protein